MKVFKEFRIPTVYKQTYEWMFGVGVAWSGECVCLCVYQSQLIGIQIRFGVVFKVNYLNLCDFNHHRSCVYISLFSLPLSLCEFELLEINYFFYILTICESLTQYPQRQQKQWVFMCLCCVCMRLKKKREKRKILTQLKSLYVIIII